MGSKGSSPTVSTVQPANPVVPNESSLNDMALARIHAGSPYMGSPWRAPDYYSHLQTPTSYVPQFNPATSGGLGAAVGNPTPQMQQMAPQQGAGGGPPGMGGGAASFWNGQGPITPGTLPQTGGGGAQMQVPTATAQAGMAQNISPSLAGLSQLLMGVLGQNGMRPPQAPPPQQQQQAPAPAAPAALPVKGSE